VIHLLHRWTRSSRKQVSMERVGRRASAAAAAAAVGASSFAVSLAVLHRTHAGTMPVLVMRADSVPFPFAFTAAADGVVDMLYLSNPLFHPRTH
jgi:hypothetical protein